MKVLLIGSGGREHALALAISESKHCSSLYCAPGNVGIESCSELVDIEVEDIENIVKFAKDKVIDLVVIGPEVPLVLGLADKLQEAGIDVFGPSKLAARLEGSKGFTKDLCKKYNIPTAAYGRFTDIKQAKAFIEKQNVPIVIKADGLAAGKGVIIAEDINSAIVAAEDMLSGNSFGKAGAEIIVEEFMEGAELSYFALTDGKTILPFMSAQDHKRVGEGDTGLNTGGMGAYSPAYMMTPELEKKILTRIIEPTVSAMQKEGCPFTGVLYAGLILVDGEPKLIEYNARFGDPECQPLMMRLQSDMLEILYATAQGRLDEIRDLVKWSDDPAMCVVMAAKGYPESYKKNTLINGLERTADIQDLVIFHAGTAKNESGQLVNIGGRVLGVTAKGENLLEAKNKVYRAIDIIDWPDGFCRRDIGWQALTKSRTS
ncbi:MAG: phosphoribosylamine--glycine ligase [Alphaproteobacteria bacterium]|nr:phosphoribosylamine--glycine ligase [Alphaproteobacteria bacterium]